MELFRKMTKMKLLVVGIMITLLLLSYKLGTLHNRETNDVDHSESEHKKETSWTCSMHPQINLPKAGKCPICFMDLIPIVSEADEDDGDRPSLTLSENASKLAGIITAPAVRRGANTKIRLTGKVAFDETKSEMIAARMSGRIDRLFVDYTGIPVKRGDHLARIYSPELIALQRELIEASKMYKLSKSSGDNDYAFKSAERTFEAAKEKLRLLGFSYNEVSRILTESKTKDHMTIRAGQKGVVLKKMIEEGAYVKTGMPLFHIVDLSQLWIKLDAYESDLVWLRLGQKVEFTVEAWPGKIFNGKISFIDPVVNPKTRTVKIRVIVENRDSKLKPDMFVKASVMIDVSKGGNVVNSSMKGKWISPMHPQIVKDKPGSCDICGMDLVKAEDLGYVTKGFENIDPLLIPATAPLFTGERAVVYVEQEKDGKKTYEGRTVVLGPAIENYYIVKSGISEGEKVVVNGAFRIDGELQIRAKPSMMNPEGGVSAKGHAGHGEMSKSEIRDEKSIVSDVGSVKITKKLKNDLENIYKNYFDVHSALAGDNYLQAKQKIEQLKKANRIALKNNSSEIVFKEIKDILVHVKHMKNIEEFRSMFDKISSRVISLEKKYGHPDNEEHYLAYCSMAFDNKGAYWIQKDKGIENPFYGAKMLKCGEIKETFKQTWQE